MKRLGAIFFLLCFLLSHSGITFAAHWCGNKITGISMVSEHNDCDCGSPKMAMKKGCCTDKLTTLKAKSDLSTSNSQIIKAPTLNEAVMLHSAVVIESLSFQVQTTPDLYRPPPNNPKLPCYLANRVILI